MSDRAISVIHVLSQPCGGVNSAVLGAAGWAWCQATAQVWLWEGDRLPSGCDSVSKHVTETREGQEASPFPREGHRFPISLFWKRVFTQTCHASY